MDILRRSDNVHEVFNIIYNTLLSLRCNEEFVSVFPTLMVALSAIRFVHQLTNTMFRRSLFRRIPLWERCLKGTINLVLAIHCVKAWFVYTRLLRWIVNKFIKRQNEMFLNNIKIGAYQSLESLVHLALCWCTASCIMIITILSTLPREEGPHLFIWIATSPWRHTEIGPTAYYLHRPIQQNSTIVEEIKNETVTLRLVQSTNNVLVKKANNPTLKKRSKSV